MDCATGQNLICRGIRNLAISLWSFFCCFGFHKQIAKILHCCNSYNTCEQFCWIDRQLTKYTFTKIEPLRIPQLYSKSAVCIRYKSGTRILFVYSSNIYSYGWKLFFILIKSICVGKQQDCPTDRSHSVTIFWTHSLNLNYWEICV